MSGVRSIGARVFIASLALAGSGLLAFGFTHWQSRDPVTFGCYLIAAFLVSPLKVGLPGIEGTLSVNFLFSLLGILELGLPETLAIGVASTFAQVYWKPARRPKAVHLVFNLSQVTVSSSIAFGTYRLVSDRILHGPGPLALLVAAIVYCVCNTAALSTIVGLTEEKAIIKVWGNTHLWLFPYYMMGAAVAGLVHFLNAHIGLQSSLLVLPPIYVMYRSYRLYLGKLESEKVYAQQVSKLHLRTIETLALAIEAKDENTGEHLQRVRVYAMELAKELGLSDDEKEALQAASVLHDIGKLAVPEHIISKPGRLTPEEFEKMKIHPIVGAEILEQVHFPYPVVPIVRAHHEKWDGSGYPCGLVGEAIPVGARILAAVDCLDALASDRQYRKALPLDEAMTKVASEAGTSFDPKIVSILQLRYVEWEKMANEQPRETPPKLSTDVKVERGAAPDAGFAGAPQPVAASGSASDFTERLCQARAQSDEIVEVIDRAGSSLRLADIFSVVAVRVRHLVPHESLAVYCPHGNSLVAEFVSGENSRLFASLRIPMGEGLSGWVAQNHKSILNGNPSVEPGYLNDATKYSTLRSALAVPIEVEKKVLAVLALYRAGQDAFTRDDLRVLEEMSAKIAAGLAEMIPLKASSAVAGPK